MKQSLLLLLLLPFAAFSQRIQSDQTNDFGKSRRIATSRIEFNGFNTSLAGVLTVNECDTILCMNLFFKPGQPITIDGKTKALLNLENGEIIQVSNQGFQNEVLSKETGVVVFAIDRPTKTKLLHYKVESYTIQTKTANIPVYLNDRQQHSFYKTIHLLESQAGSIAAID